MHARISPAARGPVSARHGFPVTSSDVLATSVLVPSLTPPPGDQANSTLYNPTTPSLSQRPTMRAGERVSSQQSEADALPTAPFRYQNHTSQDLPAPPLWPLLPRDEDMPIAAASQFTLSYATPFWGSWPSLPAAPPSSIFSDFQFSGGAILSLAELPPRDLPPSLWGGEGVIEPLRTVAVTPSDIQPGGPLPTGAPPEPIGANNNELGVDDELVQSAFLYFEYLYPQDESNLPDLWY